MQNPYAKYIAGKDALVAQTAALARFQALGAQIIAAHKSPLSFAAGKWSAAQIMLHLAQGEMMFGTRYRQAVTIPNYQLQPFEQDDWMAHEPLMNFADSLQAFVAMRTLNLNWLHNMSAAEKQLPLNHPQLGAGVVQDIINIVAGHDLNHLEQLALIAAEPA